MYAHTQDYLAKNNITELVLMRGVDLSEFLPTGNVIGKSARIETNAISSWTLDLKTAKKFSHGSDWETYRMTVPARRVFSTAITGNGCFSEWEVVLLGNKFDDAYVLFKKGLVP